MRMPFELQVVSHTPMTAVMDVDAVAVQVFTHLGYLPTGGEAADNVKESVPYRLMMECFVRRPEKSWTVEELIATLDTSRPTVYRHLNKLKGLDLLEEASARSDGEPGGRKTYRIRYGTLAKAWNFVEANVQVAMENYRKTIDHLQDLVQREHAQALTAKPAGKVA